MFTKSDCSPARTPPRCASSVTRSESQLGQALLQPLGWPEETLPHAASLSPEFPQFTRVQPPKGSTAETAWIGEIQPFASDDAARAFLHDIELGKEIWLAAGQIRESVPSKSHWADRFLVSMSVRCRLLILIEPPPAHPRAYLLRSLFPEHYAYTHPHPRFDLQIEWDGRKIPGLCIYSAAEFHYDSQRDRKSQFLEQVTIFTATHLIWLRTRRLPRGFPQNGVLQRTLVPGELLLDDRPVVIRQAVAGQKPLLDYWSGYWPGPTRSRI